MLPIKWQNNIPFTYAYISLEWIFMENTLLPATQFKCSFQIQRYLQTRFVSCREYSSIKLYSIWLASSTSTANLPLLRCENSVSFCIQIRNECGVKTWLDKVYDSLLFVKEAVHEFLWKLFANLELFSNTYSYFRLGKSHTYENSSFPAKN